VAWAVSLQADVTDVVPGAQVRLTALASRAVDGTGYAITIFSFVSGELPQQVHACESGSSCSATVVALDHPVFYQAFVNVPGGIVRDAASGKGNFGLGSGTVSQATRAGESWVGDGATWSSDGKALISRDGLRQWRAPSCKPNLNQWQSNFESRLTPSGQWQSNGHLDITDLS
jgi:hypothetical protein